MTLSCVCDLLFSALDFLLQLLVEPRFQNAFLYTTIRRGEKQALPSQRGVPCISDEPVSVALLNCENLSLVDCQTCCALSMPAVGHALLCLLLAMLFLRRLFGSACACHPRLLPVVTQRLCCSSPSSVSLGGPPDCNANSLFQLCHWLFSSPCACHPRLFFCLPEFDPLGSVVQVTIVLRHRAVLDNLTLPLSVSFSITGSSGCDSFSVLSSSDVASCERRVPRVRHFVVVYNNVTVSLVPPTPLLGLRHFVIVGSR